MDGCVLAVQEGSLVVTAQARLWRCRYPMAGPFTAGRRARSCSASGLAHQAGEVAYWPGRGCAGSCRDSWPVEGACVAVVQCESKISLLARPDGTDRTMIVRSSAVERCAIR